MIYKDLGDIRALTLIRVVLERTENEELEFNCRSIFKTKKNCGWTLTRKTSIHLPPHSLKSGWQVINHKVKLYHRQ